MVTQLHAGAILTKIKRFQMWKLIIHGYKILHGGDLNENEHYKKRSRTEEQLFSWSFGMEALT